jgi:hypothetical protein
VGRRFYRYSFSLKQGLNRYITTFFLQFFLRIEDRQGANLRSVRVPLDLAVGLAEVDFSDIDVSLIGRIVFFSNYSGIQFAIRQINFGDARPMPSAACPGLKTNSDRFESKLDSWKKEGMMGRRFIDELEELLEAFRQLE